MRSVCEHLSAMAAPERQIRGGDATVKLRDPLRGALFDTFSLGIYGTYWYYQVNKELAALGRARGTDELGTKPVNSLLALLPGILLLLVPFLVSGNRTAKRVRAAQRIAGVGETIDTTRATLALIPFPVAVYYIQRELNRVWAAETA